MNEYIYSITELVYLDHFQSLLDFGQPLLICLYLQIWVFWPLSLEIMAVVLVLEVVRNSWILRNGFIIMM